jgi:hypothetical protein
LLFDEPTSSHKIRRLYPWIAPWMQKPKGFNLSYLGQCAKCSLVLCSDISFSSTYVLSDVRHRLDPMF